MGRSALSSRAAATHNLAGRSPGGLGAEGSRSTAPAFIPSNALHLPRTTATETDPLVWLQPAYAENRLPAGEHRVVLEPSGAQPPWGGDPGAVMLSRSRPRCGHGRPFQAARNKSLAKRLAQ